MLSSRVRWLVAETPRPLGAAFVLHWFWEVGHGPAFLETQGPILWRAWHCIPMAIVDALWTLVLMAIAVWITERPGTGERHWPALVVAGLAGALTAWAFEAYAMATGRWTYAPAMPLVPMLRVGLWPVLQMTLIPPLVLAAAMPERRGDMRKKGTVSPKSKVPGGGSP